MRTANGDRITILILIRYGDITGTHADVYNLSHGKYPELRPTSQGTVSGIEKQFC